MSMAASAIERPPLNVQPVQFMLAGDDAHDKHMAYRGIIGKIVGVYLPDGANASGR